VHLSNLLGANRRFIEQHVPHLGTLIRRDLADVVQASDVLVVGLNDATTAAGLRELIRPDQLVIDLVGMPGRGEGIARYEGLCW
jgi:GDP-mannose 6-dehydrogenase